MEKQITEKLKAKSKDEEELVELKKPKTQEAAKHLGFYKNGLAKVKVEYSKHKTEQLLQKLQLPKKEGAKAIGPIKNPSCTPETFLDTICINGIVSPYMEVEPRVYCFKILNACNTHSI